MIESVSACFVVYNEAHRIERTLRAVAPHVDEIVVVDQESTDRTLDVVGGVAPFLSADVRIGSDFHHGFCEPSRKVAHELSSGDWVLALDADERISDQFAGMMRYLDEFNKVGARLKRSLWLSGSHHFTGDYQYRYFHRDHVRYLDEIHTEPQPVDIEERLLSPSFVSIWHEKSWAEQVRDELAYAELIDTRDFNAEAKLALNVHTKMLEEAGMTAEQVDEMSPEAREELFGLRSFDG